MSKIAEFYSGRTVFITGTTGFMGKVLLERMLCTLPNIKKIYVLIRPKKGLSPEERVKKMLSEKPFTFNNIPPSQLAKVSAICGDLNHETLSLTIKDRDKIIEKVSVVLHVAAVVKFDLKLKDALIPNTIATKFIFNLCTKIKNLVSVVYVSTTFCNIDVQHCEEKVYDVKQYYCILDSVNSKNFSYLENILIKPHPNTYTFTKRLTEIVAKKMGKVLPLSIVRPSIVIPAYNKPIEGWVDSINGPMGVFSAVAMGVLRVGLMDVTLKPDLVPVDIAINGIIVASWLRTLQKKFETPVYNLTLPSQKKCSWKYLTDILKGFSRKYPFQKMLWYPRCLITTNRPIYLIIVIIFQVFPAIILDSIIKLCRQKPFLVNIQRKLHAGMTLISYFSLRKFDFDTKQSKKLFDQLGPEDKTIFYGINDIEINETYLKNAYLGVQKYVFKDNGEGKLRYVKLNIFYSLDILLHCYAVFWLFRRVIHYFGKNKFIPSYLFRF